MSDLHTAAWEIKCPSGVDGVCDVTYHWTNAVADYRNHGQPEATSREMVYRDEAEAAIREAERERDALRKDAAPVPVNDRLPEEGELVLVYSPDGEGGERVDFDCIEEGDWAVHANNYDHFIAVGGAGAAGPDCVCTGPAEDAPYTHWARIPKTDAAIAAERKA